MDKFGFYLRLNVHKWGGDLSVIYSIVNGLCALGYTAIASPFLRELEGMTHLFLTGTYPDLRALREPVQEYPYGVLAFHENFLQFDRAGYGFFEYVHRCESGAEPIERLFDYPQTPLYFGCKPRRTSLYNLESIRNARICIANSEKERSILARDFPGCRTAVVRVCPGFAQEQPGEGDLFFPAWARVPSRGYILQVGRMSMRKNQLATILATRHLDIPLIFIATAGPEIPYQQLCLRSAAKWRKAPTIFITDAMPAYEEGPVRILPMPNGQKLPTPMLISAFAHAALHVHPAFQELPGLTFFEAARWGTPTVGSHWCTIDEYFYDAQQGHSCLDGRIAYATPYDLSEIQALIDRLIYQQFPPLLSHPTLIRTNEDVARDFLLAMEHWAT